MYCSQPRNVREVCRDWRDHVRSCLTSLAPRRLHATHIVVRFPYLTALNLGGCSEVRGALPVGCGLRCMHAEHRPPACPLPPRATFAGLSP